MESIDDILDNNNPEEEVKTDSRNSEVLDKQADNETINSDPNNVEDSLEPLNETTNESININTDDANTTNCLALTIQEDHKLVAVKNVFLRTIRMSWKVIVTTVTLTILKFLS